MSDPEHELDLVADTQQLIGVWADTVDVMSHDPTCTLDFFRLDTILPDTRVLVARVTLSVAAADGLRQLLGRAVASYASHAIEEALDDLQGAG